MLPRRSILRPFLLLLFLILLLSAGTARGGRSTPSAERGSTATPYGSASGAEECVAGEAAFLSGAFSEAAARFARCSGGLPPSPRRDLLRFRQGVSLARMGDFAAARALLEAIPPRRRRLYPLARFPAASSSTTSPSATKG